MQDTGHNPIFPLRCIVRGRLTQRESATLTWWKSLVQIQYRPEESILGIEDAFSCCQGKEKPKPGLSFG